MKKFLYFTADWCGPCRMLSPVMDEVAQEGIIVQKVNVDNSPEMASHYGIRNVPTVIAIDDYGNERARKVGSSPKQVYLDMYNQN